MKGKKFVASFSGGKDSTLALYRALKQGMEPIALIITFNTDRGRSWFHGVPKNILDKISKSLSIPIWLIKTDGQNYTKNFEKKLIKAKELGAETCIFGDIDIEGHLKWGTEVCEKANIKSYFPLWQEDRKKLVYEFLESGFSTYFTVINNTLLDDEFLGQVMTKDILQEIETLGVDICGENGEYHTFVFNGPIFKEKIEIDFGKKITENNYSILPIVAK